MKYSSFKEYYFENYKHIRREKDLNTSFKMPMTYNQNYGFYSFQQGNLNKVHLPKRKCPETKYAEAIIMTGKQFMK